MNSCQGSCSTWTGDPIGGWRTVPLHGVVSGTNNLGANPGSGVIINNLQTAWSDGFKTATSTPGYANFQSPIMIRCDGQANTGGAQGCTVPAITPELQISGFASGHVGAVFIYWFQTYNVDHWGQYPNGKPLTRLNNPSQASANRNALCSTGVWQPDASVPNDSCDEFPFAATYQSGNLLGLSPSQCSQARFQFANGWTVYQYAGYSRSQRCALGHVSLNYNQSVGGSYSTFIQNNRVLDGDKFWIGIYN